MTTARIEEAIIGGSSLLSATDRVLLYKRPWHLQAVFFVALMSCMLCCTPLSGW